MTAGWSTIAYEERPWKLPDGVPIPRRRRIAHAGPYLAAVPAHISGVTNLEVSTDILALAEEASTEIARFDAEIGHDLAPFSALLLRSESAASSQIENLTASAKAIALAELGDPSKQNAKVIVANTRSMEAALRLADALDEKAIIDMHAALLGDTHPEWVGHWRREQVWIRGSNYGPHGAMFIPPHDDRVSELMTDLVEFLRRDDLPVLAQAAIAHAQFETIHPFPDGNGRTGRSLVHAMLRSKGLTQTVTVPVSAGLLTDVDSYFGALSAYREGDPGAIVERMADAAFPAIDNGRTLVGDLRAIRASWDDRVTARRNSVAWRILDVLTRQPVIDSTLMQQQLSSSAPSVNSAIEHLVEVEVLTKVGGQSRNRKWAAREVLEVLDAFATRAGRRAKNA